MIAVYNTLNICHNQLRHYDRHKQKIKNNQKYYEEQKRKQIKQELQLWRELHSTQELQQECRRIDTDKHSVAVLASGGLLDTMAAVRAGFKPIWGSETQETMKRMWTTFTGTHNYGDAFNMDTSKIRQPRVLKTGFPCQDYSELGHNQGQESNRGQLYTEQAKLINKIRPDVAIIEQTNGVLQEQHRQAVMELLDTLEVNYHTHWKEIEMWRYGDASNRRRFYIVAFNKETMPNGELFEFPDGPYDEQYCHIARDIAEADEDVPQEYLLHSNDTDNYEAYYDITPEPGKIQHIGKYGEKAGDAHWPHPIQGWGVCLALS